MSFADGHDPAPAASGDAAPTPLQALLGMPSELSGTQTFQRYRWQARMAVLRWLGCLSQDDAPVAVVCEQVDDVTVVYERRLVFQQLKTRDRGSWSAAKVCADKGGLDALIRSYLAARAVGWEEVSSFELWLEGPMSDVRATVAFFTDPSSASLDLRAALVARGLPRAHLADFLVRLSIRANATPRTAIGAELHRSVGALWPGLSHPQTEEVVERLVAAAEAAQAHDVPTIAVMQLLRASDPWGSAAQGEHAAHPQVLSRQALVDLTPPLPDEPTEVLLARLAHGEGSSALELKLRQGGASAETIRRAKDLRAQADVRRQEVLAAGEHGERALQSLEQRVLTVAASKAGEVRQQATNPGIGARPAEFVSSQLLGDLAGMQALDHELLMGGQPLLVFGLLCHLSDQCYFGWRP